MAQNFPFVLANLPAGNNPVSDIDANFAVCMRGPVTTVVGNVPVWDGTAGVSVSGGLRTLPGSGTITSLVGVNGSNQLPAVSAALLTNIPAGVVFNYIAGLTLSNDSGTPNTILDIAAGTAADSTNAVMIMLGAFTKTTGGSWTAGTGNAGMGVGLTISNATWYHVFAIINSGTPDVYFDTSVTAANAPVGTTAFRRIGSFKTDSSANILAFIQQGDLFWWIIYKADINAANPGTATVTRTLASVPVGVIVQAMLQIISGNSGSAAPVYALTTDLAITDQTPSVSLTDNATAANSGGNVVAAPAIKNVRTNTSAQVRSRLSFSDANCTYIINTMGWIDNRGM